MKETEQQHSTQLIELSEIHPQAPVGEPVLGGSIGLLQGIRVKLTVVVGEAHTTLGELMAMREGSVLKVDRQADCPVDVLVEGNVIARGQLVVVGDNFGVRISDIAVPA